MQTTGHHFCYLFPSVSYGGWDPPSLFQSLALHVLLKIQLMRDSRVERCPHIVVGFRIKVLFNSQHGLGSRRARELVQKCPLTVL